jgi:hypothetical protein
MAGVLKNFAGESDQMVGINPERHIDFSDERHLLTDQQTLNAVIQR